jgi:hypothetical protein
LCIRDADVFSDTSCEAELLDHLMKGHYWLDDRTFPIAERAECSIVDLCLEIQEQTITCFNANAKIKMVRRKTARPAAKAEETISTPQSR